MQREAQLIQLSRKYEELPTRGYVLDIGPGFFLMLKRPATGRPSEVTSAMDYVVIIEKGETSYGAYVPDLPGCVAVGQSREEALALIREAIEFHLEGMRADGLPTPPQVSHIELVHVDA